jgi:large subunit ribosomal protein L24
VVKVIAGKEKGKSGKILKAYPAKGRVIIEHVNMIKKHTKPNAKNPDGGILEQEAPIHISNLMVVDPGNGEPTRIGRKLGDNDKLVRYSKKSGEEIK